MVSIDDAVVISPSAQRVRAGRLLADISEHLKEVIPAPRLFIRTNDPAPAWWQSSQPAWAQRAAHFQVLDSAWRRGHETTLVIQDNVAFSGLRIRPRFDDALAELPPHWSMLILAGRHCTPPAISGHQHLMRCTYTSHALAYLIRLRAVPVLRRLWSLSRNEWDNHLERFQAEAFVYAPQQFLFERI